jgi:hypothetical protein
MMDMKIPTWLAVASGLTLNETLSEKQKIKPSSARKIACQRQT